MRPLPHSETTLPNGPVTTSCVRELKTLVQEVSAYPHRPDTPVSTHTHTHSVVLIHPHTLTLHSDCREIQPLPRTCCCGHPPLRSAAVATLISCGRPATRVPVEAAAASTPTLNTAAAPSHCLLITRTGCCLSWCVTTRVTSCVRCVLRTLCWYWCCRALQAGCKAHDGDWKRCQAAAQRTQHIQEALDGQVHGGCLARACVRGEGGEGG